jgi:hypothetical protein
MTFKLVYNDKEYKTDIKLDGGIIIQSEPFYMEYNITSKQEYFDFAEFAKTKQTKKDQCISKSELPLSSIDNFLIDDKETIKIEVKKGQFYLMDKKLEEYLK